MTVSVEKILRKSCGVNLSRAVDVDDAGSAGQVGEKLADAVGWDDLQAVVGDALEQVRQRRSEGPFVAVVAAQQGHLAVGVLDAADDAGEDRDQVGVGGDDPFRVGLGWTDLQQRHQLPGGSPVLAQAQVG